MLPHPVVQVEHALNQKSINSLLKVTHSSFKPPKEGTINIHLAKKWLMGTFIKSIGTVRP